MAVHLTHLRIAGFKSFADPVELAVLPGLTGIVVPNGCGKSNVADALRWAMGEGRWARATPGRCAARRWTTSSSPAPLPAPATATRRCR